MKYRGLILDDEPSCHVLVKKVMEDHFDFTSAGTVDEAARLLDRGGFHCVLIDLTLPDGNGFDLYRIRKVQLMSVPVFFLTGSHEIPDKVHALSLGAEDYITKPFHPEELKARILSRLRKNKMSTPASSLSAGPLTIDLELHRVSFKGNGAEGIVVVNLSEIEFVLLTVLAMSPNRLLTRDELISCVWGRHFMGSRTVDRHVCSIRRKLGLYSDMIQTVPGLGYRLATDEE